MKENERLFNEPPDKIVFAHDIYGNVIERNLQNFRFRVSAYGVLKEGDSILVERPPGIEKYGLPGGGMEMEESINKALEREYKEETGLLVQPVRLLDIGEDLFTHDNQDAHAILIYYEVNKIEGDILRNGNNFDTAEVKFMKLDDLNEENMQRVFLPLIEKLKRQY